MTPLRQSMLDDMQLRVREGKGQKQRNAKLSRRLLEVLRRFSVCNLIHFHSKQEMLNHCNEFLGGCDIRARVGRMMAAGDKGLRMMCQS